MPRNAVLVQPKLAVSSPDAQHDLLGADDVTVLERLELRLAGRGLRQHVAEEVARLVDAAQDPCLAGEDLHRHERAGPRGQGWSRRARNRCRRNHPTGSRATVATSDSPISPGPLLCRRAWLHRRAWWRRRAWRRVQRTVPRSPARCERPVAAAPAAQPRADEHDRQQPGSVNAAMLTTRPRPTSRPHSRRRQRKPPRSPTGQVARGEQRSGLGELRIGRRAPQAERLEQVRRGRTRGSRGSVAVDRLELRDGLGRRRWRTPAQAAPVGSPAGDSSW